MKIEDDRRTKQQLVNHESLLDPSPGDYWNEMFCPYFIVVEADKDKDSYRVLSCLGGANSYNRKEEPNARVDLKDGWCFDYSKSMIVNRAWMERAVRYDTIDGFVADCYNSEKTRAIVKEWREHKRLEMLRQIEKLEAEYEEFTGWKTLKEGIK